MHVQRVYYLLDSIYVALIQMLKKHSIVSASVCLLSLCVTICVDSRKSQHMCQIISVMTHAPAATKGGPSDRCNGSSAKRCVFVCCGYPPACLVLSHTAHREILEGMQWVPYSAGHQHMVHCLVRTVSIKPETLNTGLAVGHGSMQLTEWSVIYHYIQGFDQSDMHCSVPMVGNKPFVL